MSKKGSRKYGKTACDGGFLVPLVAFFYFEGG
jgi:hypothetical protein